MLTHTLKSTSVASIVLNSSGNVCKRTYGKLAFLFHLSVLGNWFFFFGTEANTKAEGQFFLLNVTSNLLVLIKQRTWRGQSASIKGVLKTKCSFRCLTEPQLYKQGPHWWNSREFIETWFVLVAQSVFDTALEEFCSELITGGHNWMLCPRAGTWEEDSKEDPCSAGGDICPCVTIGCSHSARSSWISFGSLGSSGQLTHMLHSP